MITAIKTTKRGALWTNSNAFVKISNNFETLLKKKDKKKITVDFNILVRHQQ